MLQFVILSSLLSLSVAKTHKGHQQKAICHKGETLVQRAGFDLESNGCSKPDFFKIEGEEDFTFCCDRHDACYQICGIDKNFCESEFQKCLNHLCTRNFKKNDKCSGAANAFVMGVQMFGQSGFLESQESACQCVRTAEVRRHYEALLTSFYERFAPDRNGTAFKSSTVMSALVR